MTTPAQATTLPDPLTAHTSIRRTVEWSDTDAAGHHHNSAILRWVEACEAQLYRELGISQIFGDCPRVQQTVNYTAKLWFGQEITAKVYVDSVGSSSVTFGFNVFCEGNEERERKLAAHGTFVTVHVDTESGAATPWPQQIRHAFLGATA